MNQQTETKLERRRRLDRERKQRKRKEDKAAALALPTQAERDAALDILRAPNRRANQKYRDKLKRLHQQEQQQPTMLGARTEPSTPVKATTVIVQATPSARELFEFPKQRAEKQDSQRQAVIDSLIDFLAQSQQSHNKAMESIALVCTAEKEVNGPTDVSSFIIVYRNAYYHAEYLRIPSFGPFVLNRDRSFTMTTVHLRAQRLLLLRENCSNSISSKLKCTTSNDKP